MKKMFCVLLIALTLCSLAACGSKNNKGADNSTENPTLNTSAPQVQPTEKDSQATVSAPQVQPTEEDSQAAIFAPVQGADGIDVDLTKLSSTMVYSEVYNMMYNPDIYIGKIVKMNGQFAFYEDPDTKNQYFACIIADATACCSQGLEFTLTGAHTYPDDYPELGNEITVTGTFELYEEDGYRYCRLADATLVS